MLKNKWRLSAPFVKHLKSKGINVSLFDPYYSNKEIGKIVGVKSFKYPQGLSKFDCIVVSIDHKEFKTNIKNTFFQAKILEPSSVFF